MGTERKNDITLRWFKGESDIGVYYNAGCKGTAGLILDLFDKKIQKELIDRGYDLKTLRLTINKLKDSHKN